LGVSLELLLQPVHGRPGDAGFLGDVAGDKLTVFMEKLLTNFLSSEKFFFQ